MKNFHLFPLCLAILLSSCSIFSNESQIPATFEAYTRQNNPELANNMIKSTEKRQKKMAEAFSYLDKAASDFEKDGMKNSRKNLYANTQKVIDDLYLVYIKKQTIEPLNSLSNSLYKKMEDSMKNSGEFENQNIDKFLVYETRKQAELDFDQEFEKLFPHSSAMRNLKNFVDTYTKGFYIYNEENPEEFQQFYLDYIAGFKTDFYILMQESLKKIATDQR